MIDEIVRDGARKMLVAALQAEVAAYVEQFADQVDEDGRRLVVRNGYHQPRMVVTSAGAVEVKAPRVNDKRTDPETGERQRFSSAILPAWARRSPQITEVLPLLYLHGLSSGDFAPALEQFLGTGAGLSASSITRLTTQWQDEARAFAARNLSGVDYVYLWADGVHLKLRLEQEKLRKALPIAPVGQPIVPAKVDWIASEFLKTRVAHGYCSRHLAAGACPYANICETCDNFVPAAEHLPVIRDQLSDIRQLRADAEQRAWTDEIKRHDRVINALEHHCSRLENAPATTRSP